MEQDVVVQVEGLAADNPVETSPCGEFARPDRPVAARHGLSVSPGLQGGLQNLLQITVEAETNSEKGFVVMNPLFI